jgi:hypothetical protein
VRKHRVDVSGSSKIPGAGFQNAVFKDVPAKLIKLANERTPSERLLLDGFI